MAAKVIYARLPPDVVTAIEQYAADCHMSRTQAMAVLLRWAVDTWRQQKAAKEARRTKEATPNG